MLFDSCMCVLVSAVRVLRMLCVPVCLLPISCLLPHAQRLMAQRWPWKAGTPIMILLNHTCNTSFLIQTAREDSGGIALSPKPQLFHSMSEVRAAQNDSPFLSLRGVLSGLTQAFCAFEAEVYRWVLWPN